MPPGARPQHRRRPPPPKSNALRNTLIAIAALVAITGAGLVALSFAFPGDIVRNRIVAEVKNRTGRDLTVAGPVTFAAVPSAHVSLADVSLSGPAGMEGPPLATMQSLDVSVALWPLLWREVVVESVVVKNPVFNLVVDANNRNNWSLRDRRAAGATPVRLAQAASPPETATDADATPTTFDALQRHDISSISLNDLTIENGTLRYTNAITQKSHEATALNAKVAVRSLSNPATANGQFDYRGETIAFAAELGAIEPLLRNSSSRIALNLTSSPFNATFEGSVFPANNEAEGSLTLNAASLAKTAAWLGANVPRSAQFGTLSATGQLRSAGKTHTISNTTLTVNGASATGEVTLDTSDERPRVHGTLAIADLNLNTFVAPPPDAAPGSPRSTTEAGEGTEAPAPQQGTRVNGYTARGGWSEDPIRLTALAAANADLKLDIGNVLYKDLKLRNARVLLGLSDNVLKATIEDAALYNGRGRGFVVLDGRNADTAHVGLNFTLENVALRPLLQDAAKLNWIEGQGNATIAVAGSGAHQRGIVETLAGTADVKVAKGAVIGIDVNRMAESLADGNFKGLKTQPGDKTAFSALTATWKIDQGVATNNDLKLMSDVVQASGAGAVVITEQSLDYTIRPKLAGAQEGKGLGGIEVPVRVSGNWEKPNYKADVGGAVDELGKRLKGKDAGEIVDELIGKDSKGESKAKKLLDKLFR